MQSKVCEHKEVLLLPHEDAALALPTSQPTGNLSALSRPHDAVASASDASAEIGIAPEDYHLSDACADNRHVHPLAGSHTTESKIEALSRERSVLRGGMH